MRSRTILYFSVGLSLLFLLAGAGLTVAKDGTLSLRVTPKQAYVYIDGHPLGEGGGQFRLSPGEHTLTLYNHGYKSDTRKLTVAEGERLRQDVTLEAIPGTPAGPFGRIQLEGFPSHDVVLLNGKTPDYFVGHVDEFNNDIIWKQELLVPPGTHQITVLREGDGSELWSGSVSVEANQRVIVHLKEGGNKTTEWARGKTLTSPPRFRAGTASATVALAKPTVQLSATQGQTECGKPAQLRWTSTDAVAAQLDPGGPVAASGEQSVQPKQTTAYKLTATGPGGSATADATVNVASTIQASLSVTPAEVRYHKVGDKVEEQGKATLAWTATGADSVSLDPGGTVQATGNQSLTPTPSKSTVGPVDETLTYTLKGANACGGTETRTATLHITGSIDPASTVTETTLETKLSLNSIYFPTALPGAQDAKGGLVPSQQTRLNELASNFQQYLKFRPEAHLTLQGHADRRGSVSYNKALSERRVERVKSFLVEHGVAASAIDTVGFGKEQNMSADDVKKLTDTNPNVTLEERTKVLKNLVTFLLANNRRVDIVLSTTGQQSQRLFPYDSEDLRILLGEPVKGKAKPVKKVAEK